MRPYGQRNPLRHNGCKCPECSGGPDKGREREAAKRATHNEANEATEQEPAS
jgi:hypothetical protein